MPEAAAAVEGVLNGESPVSVTDPGFTSHLEQVQTGTPFLQFAFGTRTHPDQGPALLVEVAVFLGEADQLGARRFEHGAESR